MPSQFPDVPPKDPVIVKNGLNFSVVEDNVEWDSTVQEEEFNFPDGPQAKIVNQDPSIGRVDKLVKFPPGYIEPEHSHEGGHAAIILDGRMKIHGHELTPGDYVYGQKVDHGPMEYPDGCIVFASFVGGSAQLEWDVDPNE